MFGCIKRRRKKKKEEEEEKRTSTNPTVGKFAELQQQKGQKTHIKNKKY